MAEFLYLFRGGDARDIQQSPEQMQEHMQKWGAWMQQLGESGNFIDGKPLDTGGKVVKDGAKVVSDGPFAEGTEIVGGYLLVKADDMDQAAELSKSCPIVEYGGTVEALVKLYSEEAKAG